MDQTLNGLIEFARWLRKELAARQERDPRWTQTYLARRAGVSHSTISRIMGARHYPQMDTLMAIARALNLPPHEVFRQAGYPGDHMPDARKWKIREIARLLAEGVNDQHLDYIYEFMVDFVEMPD